MKRFGLSLSLTTMIKNSLYNSYKISHRYEIERRQNEKMIKDSLEKANTESQISWKSSH